MVPLKYMKLQVLRKWEQKITKNEKIFLKLLFFKIISNSSFLDNAEIRLDEINATPEFSSITDYASFFKNLTEKRIFFTVSLSDNQYYPEHIYILFWRHT